MKVFTLESVVLGEEPAKNSTQASFCACVRPAGCTTAVPVVIAKALPAPSKVTPLSSQPVTSTLSSHVNAGPVCGACMYSANWQSPPLPDVTPPEKSHQPQKPKPERVPG